MCPFGKILSGKYRKKKMVNVKKEAGECCEILDRPAEFAYNRREKASRGDAMKCYRIKLNSLPKILLAYDVTVNNYKNTFPHERDYLEISLILDGNLVYEPAAGEKEKFFAGSILTLLPDFCGKTFAEGGFNHHVTVGFQADYEWRFYDTDRMDRQEIAQLLQDVCSEDVYLLPFRGETGENYPFLEEYLLEMARYYPGGLVADLTNCKAVLFKMLSRISLVCAGELSGILHGKSPGSKLIYCGQIKEYIHRHYRERLTLERLAGQANVSVNYMCRIFKEVEQCTVNEYLTAYRMKIAEALLRKGGMTVGEIAAAVGIEDVFYFRKLFRRRFGMKVTEYRNINA